MEAFKYCKVQIALLLILLYTSYLFVKDGNRLNSKTKTKNCNRHFDRLFLLGEFALLMDGLTAYTVNHLDTVPKTFNMAAHLIYLLTYQAFVFTHFMYWLSVTDSIPKKAVGKICCYAPITVSGLVTTVFISKIYYYVGEYTNYAKGIPAIACYSAIGLYSILTMIIFIVKKNYIQKNKRTAFIMALSAVVIISLTQLLYNELLVAGIAVALVIMGIYLCMENPSNKFLEYYHDEMVMGFATLVDNKDGSTGGHIRRSSAYAVMIADTLRKNPKYKNIITKDFIINLQKAAPMHDIGKIGIPDNILQKPGRLTDEEFEVMRKHPEIGYKIIRETFGHLDDENYVSMASDVALGHHEKWNGKGYPGNLKETEIPLCARIMAVADVFDAVSEKRCYRDALPLEACYQIILDGRGQDFDPDVVDAFFADRNKIEKIYSDFSA